MRKFRSILVVAMLLVLAWSWQRGEFAPSGQTGFAPAPGESSAPPAAGPRTADPAPPALPAFLPPEAARTLALIERGGPFPYRQDGTEFQNRERRLPERPRGHYREYTVPTPGLGHRGPRRIVTGGDPPRDYWYTDDHYTSFRRFEVPR